MGASIFTLVQIRGAVGMILAMCRKVTAERSSFQAVVLW